MPLTFQKKQELVDDLSEKIKNSKSMVFADFSGLPSESMSELRNRLRKENIVFRVVKKTLLKRVLRFLGLGDIAEKEIPGQLSVAFGVDEVGAAKSLSAFIKETKTENLGILGGVLEQKFLTKNEVISLAKVPTRQESLGLLVGTLKSPMSGLVNVLGGNIRNLILVLKQIKDLKHET